MKKITFLIVLLSITLSCVSQQTEYSYRRQLNGIKETWHKILLPDEIFTKVSPSLSDIRILQINGRDTTEAPYILTGDEPESKSEPLPFQLINRSNNNNGYYFTFHLQQRAKINTIQLHIGTANFDWLTDLEGSHDQENWFTLIKDYRIVALQNEQVNFKFERIIFPSASYKYFRLLIKSKVDPQMTEATLTLSDTSPVTRKAYAVKTSRNHNGEKRISEYHADLSNKVPVSRLRLVVKDTFDYLRQVIIERMVDSFQTEKGWRYNYATLHVGALHSQGTNEFNFPVVITQKLLIKIIDGDNEALQVESVEVLGPQYAMLARFNRQGQHYLYYGNADATYPEYDIKHFVERVPTNAPLLEVGKEEAVKSAPGGDQPLFMNKLWLWVILLVIVAILGWFSIRMLKQRNAES